MTVRPITAVAVECDHRDGRDTCDSALLLRATDPGDIDRPAVLVAAAMRGWTVDDQQLCPKHRPITPAAPMAETGA
ncbi:hypothetical protein [Pseudonocardia broussonetiae]|uniref:Uncharacterized protein n=1 Tax=Pseudonocardia broussonetiae TaxID=2736640 RepID=A0A6M6JHM2_9PSEU|nr:hypothetical protein [Pseudonocardia broussonetiae]QJY46683.1 hypothetical protein HOP40_13340 [Pseudonocardia broussonetiae]